MKTPFTERRDVKGLSDCAQHLFVKRIEPEYAERPCDEVRNRSFVPIGQISAGSIRTDELRRQKGLRNSCAH